MLKPEQPSNQTTELPPRVKRALDAQSATEAALNEALLAVRQNSPVMALREIEKAKAAAKEWQYV